MNQQLKTNYEGIIIINWNYLMVSTIRNMYGSIRKKYVYL